MGVWLAGLYGGLLSAGYYMATFVVIGVGGCVCYVTPGVLLWCCEGGWFRDFFKSVVVGGDFAGRLVDLVLTIYFALTFPTLSFTTSDGRDSNRTGDRSVCGRFGGSSNRLVYISGCNSASGFPRGSTRTITTTTRGNTSVICISIGGASSKCIILVTSDGLSEVYMSRLNGAMGGSVNSIKCRRLSACRLETNANDLRRPVASYGVPALTRTVRCLNNGTVLVVTSN